MKEERRGNMRAGPALLAAKICAGAMDPTPAASAATKARDDLRFMTFDNYWKIVDYIHRLEISSSKEIEEVLLGNNYVGAKVGILHYRVETKRENLLLHIRDDKSGIGFSITFENPRNAARLAPLGERAKALQRKDLVAVAEVAFRDIVTETDLRIREKNRLNQATGNCLTIDNFRKIKEYVCWRTEVVNYCRRPMGDLLLEYGHARLMITDRKTGEDLFADESLMERETRGWNRSAVNDAFKRILEVIDGPD
jgi:hypothetical protein